MNRPYKRLWDIQINHYYGRSSEDDYTLRLFKDGSGEEYAIIKKGDEEIKRARMNDPDVSEADRFFAVDDMVQ